VNGDVSGPARLGRRTKDLVKRLRPEDVAFLDHADLDRVSAEELVAMRQRGDDFVLVDGRTWEEYQRFNIPGGIACPNGELPLRIGQIAPDPKTTIVVNCAGRTRSIIGAQTLIDFGVPNRTVALENGTQGFSLADPPRRLLLADTKADAEKIWEHAQQHSQMCFIGQGNRRPNQRDYIAQYWK